MITAKVNLSFQKVRKKTGHCQIFHNLHLENSSLFSKHYSLCAQNCQSLSPALMRRRKKGEAQVSASVSVTHSPPSLCVTFTIQRTIQLPKKPPRQICWYLDIYASVSCVMRNVTSFWSHASYKRVGENSLTKFSVLPISISNLNAETSQTAVWSNNFT